MKNMLTKIKRAFALITWLAAIMLLALACSGRLDIVQDYGYHVETLPLPGKLRQGETIDLEFSIIRDGYYTGTRYKFRYFQSKGQGILSYKGEAVPVNRFRDIEADNFVITYQSLCDDTQKLDFVFEDSSGSRVEYSISFDGEATDREEERKEENESQKISYDDYRGLYNIQRPLLAVYRL
jgi:hypothetical protein